MGSVKNLKKILKGEEGTLDDKIKSGLAKLEGYEQLDVARRMSRSADRMERHYESFAKEVGKLKPEPEDNGSDDDMRDHIVLGDQITIGDEAIKAMADDDGGEEEEEEEEEEEPTEPEKPPPEKPPVKPPDKPPTPLQRAAPWLIAGALLSATTLGGLSIINNPTTPPPNFVDTDEDTGSVIEKDTG